MVLGRLPAAAPPRSPPSARSCDRSASVGGQRHLVLVRLGAIHRSCMSLDKSRMCRPSASGMSLALAERHEGPCG